MKIFLAFLWTSLLLVPASATMTVTNLRCEYQINPLGVDAPQPRLSWTLQSGIRGDTQTAYRILAASTSSLLASGTGDLWDSGKVSSGQHVQITYAGSTLPSAQAVYWQVQVWDASGTVSAWSNSATWTMGLLNTAAWQSAQWITPSTTANDAASTLMRREFTVSSGLTRAVVYVCGLGQYEMLLNGGKVGQNVLSGGWSTYNKTCLYDTYDITSLLQTGPNAVGLWLGNGMYNIPNSNRYSKFGGSYGPREAIAQILLQYSNGTTQTIITDGNWKWSSGPVTFNTVFGGEDYDARQEQTGWNVAGFNAASWSSVISTTGPGGVLRGTSYAAPPITVQSVVTPVAPALNGAASTQVYDFGQNASQIPTISVYGSAGATVTLYPSELGSTSGSGSISQIVSPVYMTYTLKGSTAAAPETFTPRFFYFGYRYLQVVLSGTVTVSSLKSSIIASTSPAAGSFSCSNTLFNNILSMVRWAQQNNTMSIITDCPTREKLGWLEQDYLDGPSLRYDCDYAALYNKTMQDMADSQSSSGLVYTTAPHYTSFGGAFDDSPEWDSNFILSAWYQYQYSGDTRVLSQYYTAMKGLMTYFGSHASGYILNYGLGDWYDIGPNPPGSAQLTPIAITATTTYYRDASTMAQIAQVLGNTADAATYTTLASNISTAFNNSYYNSSSGTYSTASQTSEAIPLELGMVAPANTSKVMNALVQSVQGNGNAMTSGDIGEGYLMRALTDFGRPDVVFDMQNRTGSPGYGYVLSQGATSMAESLSASSSDSWDHFFLGEIVEWFYHDVSGIQPDPTGPGFKKIIIKPCVVGNLTSANGTYNSIQGPIASNWTLSGSLLTLNVSIPPGSTATVYVPTPSTTPASVLIQESGTTIWQNGVATGAVSGVTYNQSVSNNPVASYVVWNVGSGTYQFTAQMTPGPTGLVATAGTSQVSLTWNAVSGATSYNVRRSTTSGGPYTLIATGVTTASYTDTFVGNNIPYYYVVSAITSQGESMNTFEVQATPTATILPANYGFETPSVSGYQYNPSGASWTFTAQSGSNGSGITSNGSGFTSSNSSAPQGTQVAFLQGVSAISEIVSGLVPGVSYTVSFSAAQRSGYTGQSWKVTVNGSTVASYTPSQATTSYQTFTSTFIATAASETLAFVGTDTNGGDNTIFLDNIQITTNPNYGFETPSVGTYQYNPTGASWTFTAKSGANGSGITANGSGFTSSNSAAPQGAQVAFLQGASTISESLPGFVPGVQYAVSFSAAQRAGNSGQSWKVTANGSTFATYAPAQATTSYQTFTATFTATAASETLAFVGTNTNGGDNTVFLDNVQITPLSPSSPSTWTATPGNGQVALAWSASTGATGYNIARSTTSGGPYTTLAFNVNGTSYTDTSVANGTTYYYVVAGINYAGQGANSAEISALPLPPIPSVPAGLAATPVSSQIQLNWNTVGYATSYNVKRSTVGGGAYSTIASPVATTYTDTSVTPGTTYTYVVSAVDAAGESANSTPVAATLPTAYQQWKTANGYSALPDSATPDGDGVPILLKYATAMTPGTPSAYGPATVSAPNNTLAIQFNRVSPAPANFVVEASTDLSNWSSIASLATGSDTWTGPATVTENPAAGTPRSVTVTDIVPIGTGERFLRLRVVGVSGTVAQGYYTVTLPGPAISIFSLPLDSLPVARGTLGGVTTNGVTVAAAGSWATPTAPYAVRMISGNAAGATFPISAVSGNVLTLATQGMDLTQLMAVGDTYVVFPLDTLGGIFGTNNVAFQTGASSASADQLEMWSGTGWLVYYNNGSNWRQSGSLLNQNNTVLPPDAGILIQRPGSNQVSFNVIGRVHEVAPRQFTNPGGITFLSSANPLGTPLSATGFTSASGWLSGTNTVSADNINVWSGTGWLVYFYNGAHWRQAGSLQNQDATVLPSGQGFLIVRHSAPSVNQSMILQPLPYVTP